SPTQTSLPASGHKLPRLPSLVARPLSRGSRFPPCPATLRGRSLSHLDCPACACGRGGDTCKVPRDPFSSPCAERHKPTYCGLAQVHAECRPRSVGLSLSGQDACGYWDTPVASFSSFSFDK
ncbi:hypothetical protein BaRGS_00026404, partial [Batillaria attramentaria]